jgi:hypothetical protein
MAGLYVLFGVGLLIASPARRATLLQIPAMIREAITPVPQTRETVGERGRSAPAPH